MLRRALTSALAWVAIAGCTVSSAFCQALTGGALLSAGSWIFIVACFASGYALAPLARRLWR
jgi:hypothetical protein